MPDTKKDTIYIDVDDEITAIINKVRASEHKIVALVLPKRATVLHSIVNMKLLKKSAVSHKKSLVLISSEAGLMPLAGAVGIHVAPNLQSKPAIPIAPEKTEHSGEEVITEEVPDTPVDKARPVGELAGTATAAAEVDDEAPIELDTNDAALKSNQKPSKPYNKKLKVPNFERFRLRFILLILFVIAVIFGGVYAFVVVPHADVTIVTDSTTVPISLQIDASDKLKEAKLDQKQLPAVVKKIKKTDTEKIETTGQKDIGDKATGKMTLTNCIDDGQPHTIPAGTTFSDNGIAFVSDEAVDLDPALYSGPNCKSADFGLSKDVAVTASQAGDKYNLSSRSYTAAVSGIRASGTDMTGGTSKLVKVVSQNDIDGAVAKIKGRLDDSALTELKGLLSDDGAVAIEETKVIGEPAITATPAVGKEADSVTVKAVTEYSLTGVNLDDLKNLIKKEVEKQIDKSKQSILDDGITDANFRVDSNSKPGDVTFTLITEALAGPQLDKGTIIEAIKGKRRGEAETIITGRPGIKDVTITYTPFWVFSTPKNPKHISVHFEQPAVTKKSTDDSTEQP